MINMKLRTLEFILTEPNLTKISTQGRSVYFPFVNYNKKKKLDPVKNLTLKVRQHVKMTSTKTDLTVALNFKIQSCTYSNQLQ